MGESMAFTKKPAGFVPTPRFVAAFREKFVDDATYWLSVEPERSEKTHDHQFAWIGEAWKTLPDDKAAAFPNSDVLRKHALIMTGWCDVRDYPCASKAEALRLAATLRGEISEYVVVIVRAAVVRVCRAKSQSRKAMGAADFQASKNDLLRWISDLLGVEPETLARAA
jgi:hypothetical protein